LKLNPKITLLCFSCLLSFAIKAQDSLHNKSPDSLRQSQSSIDTSFNSQLDLIDLYNRIIKKSTIPRQDLKSTHLSALPVVGYSLQTGFAAVISANLGFYTEKHNHNTEKISSLLTSITYSQYQQIIFPVQTDIWFLNNKYNVITDWRYMKYPSTTFGLGGKSNINNGYTIDFN
jgi:hypothetical protein